jgi:hypothetical protein
VDGGCVLFNESCALLKVIKMSRIWYLGLISLGIGTYEHNSGMGYRCLGHR